MTGWEKNAEWNIKNRGSSRTGDTATSLSSG
jgi:hypothetical protein